MKQRLHDDGTPCPGAACKRWGTGVHQHMTHLAIEEAAAERKVTQTQAEDSNDHSDDE